MNIDRFICRQVYIFQIEIDLYSPCWWELSLLWKERLNIYTITLFTWMAVLKLIAFMYIANRSIEHNNYDR